MKRLSKHKRRKISRYICPQIPSILLLDFPAELWESFKCRSEALGISLSEFLQREQIIERVIAAQLASLDPAVAAQGGQSSKPGPHRIERIFERLK